MSQENNLNQKTPKENTQQKFDKKYGPKSTPIEMFKFARLALNGRVAEFYDLKKISVTYVEKMFNLEELGGYLPQIFDITSRDIDFRNMNRHIFVDLKDFDSIISNMYSQKSPMPVGNLTFVLDIPIEIIKTSLPVSSKEFNNLISNAFKRIPGKIKVSDEMEAEIIIRENQISTGISSFTGEAKTTNVVIKLCNLKNKK